MFISEPSYRILSYPNFDKLINQGKGLLFYCPAELEQELSDFLVKEKIYPCISDAVFFQQYDVLLKQYAYLFFENLQNIELLEVGCQEFVKTMFLYVKKHTNSHSEYYKINQFCSWILSLKNPPKDLLDFAQKYYV